MSKKNREFIEIAEKIIEKLKSKEECEKDYVVEYKKFNWKIKFGRIKEVFRPRDSEAPSTQHWEY